MIVRLAKVADAEGLERIRIRGWQTAYRTIFPPEELDALEVEWSRWEKQIRQPPPGWTNLVAEDDGTLLGFAVVGPSRDQEGIGELYGLYVDPLAWSRGVGRALIERAEERLAEVYAEATLWVLEDNPRARNFYERAGWALDGAREGFERLGVSVPQVRYRKALSSSRSRS
jgi:GNAT superfamily N-acetyltransferase